MVHKSQSQSQRKLVWEQQRLRDVQSWKKTKVSRVAHFTHMSTVHTHRVKKCDDKCTHMKHDTEQSAAMIYGSRNFNISSLKQKNTTKMEK